MDPLPRPPLIRRLPPGFWTALTWSAAAAFPVAAAAILVLGHTGLGSPRGQLIVIMTAFTTLPFGLLRWRPLAALLLLLAAAVISAAAFSDQILPYAQFLAADLALLYLTATRPRRMSAAAGLVSLAALALVPFVRGRLLGPDMAIVVALTFVVAWVAGSSIRQRLDYGRTLREQATAQAVTTERLRIARDLHDLVAHSIGVIAFQAGMGSRVIDTQPDEARGALLAIEGTSRETLAGLRRMLGALRPADADGATSPLGPSPALADLGLLTATAARAGVRMEVSWQGERRPLAADVELSAYRIITEAVTNVIRHARTDRCQVAVSYQPGELLVGITDDGPSATLAPDGYGITGMRERAELLGGQLTAGPRPEGGFGVTARIPVPAPAPAGLLR